MATLDENRKYWHDRESSEIAKRITTQKHIEAEATKRYRALQTELNNQVNSWLAKYAGDEGITMADAKKAVEKADIEYLSKRAKKIVSAKDFSKLANEQMKLYNLTMRINRYRYLMAELGMTVSEFYSKEEAELYKAFYGAAMDEYALQSAILGIGVKGTTKSMEALIKGSYNVAQYGKDIWSQRLWGNAEATMNYLGSEITRGIIAGENGRKLGTRIKKALDVSKNVADRLARTELARIQNQVQMDSYKEFGNEKYIFTTEASACKICLAKDGHIYNVDDATVGRNLAPLHPNCRCSTSPYIDRDELMARLVKENKTK